MYDLATGRHISTCTKNSEVGYTYDALGRLETVTVSRRNNVVLTPAETTTYTYTAVGSRQSVTLPNGIVTTYGYDTLNRLIGMTNKLGATTLATYTYTLGPTGRRTGATEIIRGEYGTNDTTTLTWQYDGMYRLTNEDSSSSLPSRQYSIEYRYDKAGNRLKKIRSGTGAETVDYTYNANDQLTSEVSNTTTTYGYDANGSLTSRTNGATIVSYAYNLANKLSSVTSGGTTTAFQYNDQGIRVRSMTSSSTNHFLIDANNHTGYAQILEELTAVGGTPQKSYVIGDDVLGQCGSTSSDPRWLLYDGHGSTRQLASNAGAVSAQYDFDSYGDSLSALGSDPATRLLYCGEQFDTDLGMYNLRARYYNPANGTFNQRDTYEGDNFDPQSLHKYAYCHSDPINRSDPSGHFAPSPSGSLVETLMVSAIMGILAATLLFGVVTGIVAIRGFNETAKAQQEYKELATRLNAKVLDTVYYSVLEKGEGFPRVPGVGNEPPDGHQYFLHGGSNIDWLNQVRIKPDGEGDFGRGYYTFAASIQGVLFSAGRAITRTKHKGGYPFILVTRLSDSDYQGLMSDALDVRGNDALWRQTVMQLWNTGTASHPVVVGPMAKGDRMRNPEKVVGPDQFKWEQIGGGVRKHEIVFIIPVFQVGYYGQTE